MTSLFKKALAVAILSVAVLKAQAQLHYINADSLIRKILPTVQRLLQPGRDEQYQTAYRAGCAWYLYEFTKDKDYEAKAQQLSKTFFQTTAHTISSESVMSSSIVSGHGFRMTGTEHYLEDLLQAANRWRELHSCTVMKYGTGKDSLFVPEPEEGPCSVQAWHLPELGIVFEAARHDQSVLYLRKLAIKYADLARENLVNPDRSVSGTFTYNGGTGEKITYKEGEVRPGSPFLHHEDRSLYTSNQAALIYGFAVVYRETKKGEFLKAAQDVADEFIRRLPADAIPLEIYADSTDGAKNPVAGAMVASALFELAIQSSDVNRARIYKAQAKKLLTALGTGDYLKPGKIDEYYTLLTDYYYLEALVRLKRLENGKTLYEPF